MREFKFFSLCLVVIFLTAMELAIAGPPNVKGGPLKKADELKNNPAIPRRFSGMHPGRLPGRVF